MQQLSILIVEDEPTIADTLLYALEQDGFNVTWCSTGESAREHLLSNSVDLTILDVGLPDINGFELFRQIRTSSNVPVIFLTARSDEIDRVAGLEMGGDDYITKPFSPREVAARARAVLRRSSTPEEVSAENRFIVDEEKCQILYCGKQLDLSRYEYRILTMMIAHPERVYTRSEIMNYVWDEPEVSSDRTVDTHIKKLRRKLRDITPDSDPFMTRRGIGYALKAL